MRMILEFENPPEPFNSMVKDGTAGPALQKVLAENPKIEDMR